MSVTRISPISGKDGEHGGVLNKTASRRWLVLTNSRYDDEVTVLSAGLNGFTNPGPNGLFTQFPVPFWDFHPTWSGLLCRSMGARQDEAAPLKWIATAQYSSEPLSLIQQQEQFVPPLERPAKIRQRKSKRQIAQNRDVFGKPYVNSAGDPVDPPIELPRGYPIYIITKNVAAVPPEFMLAGDAINSSPFFIEDLYVNTFCARIDDWDRSDLQTETDFNGNLWYYYILTWSMELNLFEIDPVDGSQAGWKIIYLDQGFRANRYTQGIGINRYNIMDDATPPQPVTTPVLLDGNGFVLQNPSFTNARYNRTQGYFSCDFNNFPLF